MEIMRLNIISDIVSPIPKVPQLYTSVWKWGALILALVATFTSIITRIKLFLIRLHSIKTSSFSSSSHHLLQHLEHDFDDTSSSLPESDNEEIFESGPSFHNQMKNQFDEDFRVAGSSSYRENQWKNGHSNLLRRRGGGDRFSWSDFASGKSVVKLWDSLGLGLDFKDSFGREISVWDLGKDQKVNSFLGGSRQIPAVTMSSPAVLYLAEMSNSDRAVLGAYDRRMRVQIPAVYAEWGQRQGNVVGVSSGGVEKVYVKGGVTDGAYTVVGDMRNVKTPLLNLIESDADTLLDVTNE